jgi:hypothetical protein
VTPRFLATVAAALTLSLPTAWALPLTGGVFTLNGQTSGGGGRSAGGDFILAGLVHEQSSGHYSGNGFDLKSPAGIFQVILGDVPLEIALTARGQVAIHWPAVSGYRLQFSSALGSDADWQDAAILPGATSFTQALSGRSMFYRLIRP